MTVPDPTAPRASTRHGSRLRRVALLFGVLVVAAARADMEEMIQLGVVHAQTLDSSTPLHTDLKPSTTGTILGVADSFDSPGTRLAAGNGQTLLLTGVHFFDPHTAIKIEGGIPPMFKLYGSGTVAPTGPSGTLFRVDLGAPQNNPLASARQWSPLVLLQYYFLPQATVDPYFGLGLTYMFFTHVRLDPEFEQSLNDNFGRVLALNTGSPGPTTARARASSSFAPIFNLGATLHLSPHWSTSFSMSYLLAHTNAEVQIHAADGTLLATSRSHLELNTIATGLLVDYRFRF